MHQLVLPPVCVALKTLFIHKTVAVTAVNMYLFLNVLFFGGFFYKRNKIVVKIN